MTDRSKDMTLVTPPPSAGQSSTGDIQTSGARTTAGDRLTLLNINKSNLDLLSIAEFVAVFGAFDTEQTAIESCSAAGPV